VFISSQCSCWRRAGPWRQATGPISQGWSERICSGRPYSLMATVRSWSQSSPVEVFAWIPLQSEIEATGVRWFGGHRGHRPCVLLSLVILLLVNNNTKVHFGHFDCGGTFSGLRQLAFGDYGNFVFCWPGFFRKRRARRVPWRDLSHGALGL